MKSLIRWTATLGLIGSALLGPALIGGLQALALSEKEVVEKLHAVPVFTIANKNGEPLVASVPNGQNKTSSVAGIFVSRQDAQAFIDGLKGKNPDLAKNVSVVPLSLGAVYEMNQKNKGKPDQLEFAMVPTKKQTEAAVSLLKKNGQSADKFNGVPLFIVRFGPNQGYVSIQVPAEKKEIVPIFFSKDDAENLLSQVKGKQPAADIQVLDIDVVVQTLLGKNEPWLKQVYLIPAPESREFLRSLGGAQGASPASNRPAQQR